MILTSVTNNNLKMVPYPSHQYDLVYMFQRYSLNPESFIQWFIKKMNLTGNEFIGLIIWNMRSSFRNYI